MLAIVSWDGGGNDLSWQNAANWSGDLLPGPDDDVVIDVVESIAVTHSGGNTTVKSLTSAEDLFIEGGTLRVTGPSVVNGEFLMAPGTSLTSEGPDASFLATADTSIDGASLFALAGGELALPNLLNYAHTPTGISQTRTFRASGSGSLVDLSNLSSITGGADWNSDIAIDAADGGQVDLSGVHQILDFIGGDTRERDARITAGGAGSLINLASLTTFQDDNADRRSTLTATGGGAIAAGSLVDLRGVNLSLDGTGTLPVAQFVRIINSVVSLSGVDYGFTSLTDVSDTAVSVDGVHLDLAGVGRFVRSWMTLSGGGTVDLTNAWDVDGSSFIVNDGVTLSLPSVTTYAHSSTGNSQARTFRASGAGSLLDLSHLTGITGGEHWNSDIAIEALNGGKVDLGNVTAIVELLAGDTRERDVRITADGAGSLIDLAALVTFQDSNTDRYSSLVARNGGEVAAGNLVDLRGIDVTLDGTGTLPVAQIASLTDGIARISGAGQVFTGLTDASGTAFLVAGVHADLAGVTNLTRGSVTLSGGGTADLANASRIDGASFLVSDGVALSLPAATTYAHLSTGNSQTRTFQASGAGSLLDLSNLTGITGGVNWNSDIAIDALSGGKVDLRNVAEIVEFIGADTREQEIRITADGANSLIDLAALATIQDSNPDRRSSLVARNAGTIAAGNLVDLRSVSLVLDGTGTLPIAQLATFINGYATISGVDHSFDGLTNAAGSVFVVDGVHADFSGLTNLTGGSLTLNGGGTADLTRAAYIDGASFVVNGGVTLSLPAATTYAHASTGNSQTRTFRASGAGSLLDLSGLTSITGGSHWNSDITIDALSGGRIDLGNVDQIVDFIGGDTREREIRVTADGADSLIDLASLANFHDDNADRLSSLTATGGGTIDVDPAAVSFVNVTVALAGSPPSPGLEPATAQPPATAAAGPLENSPPDEATPAAATLVAPPVLAAALSIGQTVLWIGADGDWSDPGNWSTGQVPGPRDDVVIDLAAGDVTVTISAGNQAVRSLRSEEAFVIAGGSLTVTGTAEVNGSFTMAGDTALVADGAAASFVATGTTTADGASFYARSGGQVVLPNLTEYAHAATSNSQLRTFRARGSGSLLDLSNLTSIVNGTAWNSDISIEALAGGRIDLGSVTQIVDNAGGDTRERVIAITADGTGSLIDLGALVTLQDSNADRLSTLAARNGGTIASGSLTELDRFDLTLDETGTLAISQITTFVNGIARLSGKDHTFTDLTDASSTVFLVDRVHADLGRVTDFSRASLALTGGGTADLTNAANIDGASFFVGDGVTLSLPAATAYSHAATGNSQVRTFRARGSGSLLDLSNLTSVVNGTAWNSDLSIEALVGGRVDLGAVTGILDNAGGDTRERDMRITADGPGSLIDLGAMLAFHDANTDRFSTLVARSGGKILAGSLEELQGVDLTRDGSGSLPISQITTLTDSVARLSGMDHVFTSLTNASGTAFLVDRVHVDLGGVTDFSRASVTLDGGGTVDLTGATNIDGASFFVGGGVTLSLPAATVYAHASTGNSQPRTFRARGSGSRLDLSNLTSLTNGAHWNSDISVEALAGGWVDLGSVTEILDNAGGDTREREVAITADGAGSLIDLGAMTTYQDSNPDRRSPLVAIRGGTVDIGSLTDLNGVDLTSDGSGTLSISQIATFTNGVARLSGVDHLFGDLTNAAGSTFLVDRVHADLGRVTNLSWATVSLTGGGTLDLGNAANIDGASFLVNGGVTLSLPAATGYSHASTGSSQLRTFRAQGAGSRLDLAGLTGITNGTHWNSDISIEALTGGRVDLGGVAQILDNAGGDTREREMRITADGVGSQIGLGSLTTWHDANADRLSGVTALNRGNVDFDPAGTSFERVQVNIESESTISGSLELLPGSVMGGSGRLVGNLLNHAQVWPVGELTVDGNFTQTETGRVVIDIGGLTPISEHDLFTVTGAADVDGTLEVARFGGFAPANGDSFRVMTFASRTGVFQYAGLDTGAGAELSPELTPVDLTLVAGFSTGPSVTGLAGSDSSVATDGPFIDVTFSEPIDLATFTVDDVTIVGPGGAIGFQPPELVPGTVNVYRIRLEPSEFVDGSYDLTIGPEVRDFVGNPMNQDGDGLNGEPGEDVFSGSVDVFLPDLVVDPPTVDPTSAQFGEDLDVSWTVRNAGASTAAGAWKDTVWLSTDTVIDAGDVLLATVAAGTDSPLGVGGSYDRLTTVSLPILAQLVTGTYYVVVATDALNVTSESNEANNASVSAPLDLTFPAMPDLRVTVDAAPTSGQPAESVPISWTVVNAGDAPAVGPWVDRLYLSADGQLAGATLVASVVRSGDLADGIDYAVSIDAVLPSLADGDYTLIVVTDAAGQVFEGLNESNNQDAAAAGLQMRHADLVPTIVSAPASAISGDEITIRWNTTNNGTTSTLAGWLDRVYLSVDQQLSGNDRLLGEVSFGGPLGVAQSEAGELTAALPVDISGNWHLIVMTDAAGAIGELGGEANNTATSPIDVQLAPYADLAVTGVDGPGQVIGDPASVTVSWTVENRGTGAGLTDSWTDAVIASTDDVLGNADDLVLARFDHTGGLGVLADYTRTETVLLAPETVGRFHLFVKTDVDGVVFENGLEANNAAESDEVLDVMAIPYADLVVTSIGVDPTAASGREMDVTWTVENQGIGTTSPGQWTDRVYLV